jgi:hypothetical protein
MEVPMLEEAEFKIAKGLYNQMFSWGRKDLETKVGGSSLVDYKQPLLNYYNELTRWSETNPNAIMHHEIAQYGEPCAKCGKPLRTPNASFCAACGHKK